MPWQFEVFYGGVLAKEAAGTVLTLNNARICGNGAVIDARDLLIGDVSRELIQGGDQRKHSVFSRFRLPPVERLEGSTAVVSVDAANVYWHWMVDLVPRLHLLLEYEKRNGPVDRIAVNRLSNPFMRPVIEALGIPANRFIETTRDAFHIRSDRLVLPSISNDVLPTWASEFLSGVLGPSLRGATVEPCERLYVSRSDARARRVLNEDAVMSILEPLGFRRVVLTGTSVADQALLFSHAEVIVGPHGSGFTNMVFSRPGTLMIELFEPGYMNPCYWAISDSLKMNYFSLVGEGAAVPAPPAGQDGKAWFFKHMRPDPQYGQDMYIDIDKMKNVLMMAGIAS